MKKLAAVLTAAVLLFSASSFAANGNEGKTNAAVAASFQKDFALAKNVTWKQKSNFYFATFTVGNNTAEAAYNEDGELMVVSRKIALSQLPLSISVAIAKKYDGYVLGNDAEEVTYDNETYYYVTIANERKILKLKSSASGVLTVEKKVKR